MLVFLEMHGLLSAVEISQCLYAQLHPFTSVLPPAVMTLAASTV